MKTIDIHGKPYVMVKDRVIHFNKEYPNGCIKTKKLPSIENIVIFEATVVPDVENPERLFKGHAEESVGSSQINTTSALENCETSAVGRALAMMGIGADESFASADEVANAISQQDQAEEKVFSIPEEQIKKMNTISNNGLQCPVCKGGLWDNRKEDVDGKKIINEKKHPAFKCRDTKCTFVTWECDPKLAKVLQDGFEDEMVLEKAPHKDAEDQDHYEEAMESVDQELQLK